MADPRVSSAAKNNRCRVPLDSDGMSGIGGNRPFCYRACTAKFHPGRTFPTLIQAI